MKTEYVITFVIVVLAVFAAAWIGPKIGLSSYEEYYEQA